MNIHDIEGNWKQFTDYCKRRWGRLADQQLELLTGKRRRAPIADKQAGQQQVPPPK